MGLKEEKELADIRDEVAAVIQQLNSKTQDAINHSLKNAATVFRSHLQGEGFVVQGEYPGALTASYKTVTYSLAFDTQQRIGAFAMLTLQRTSPKGEPTSILLTRKSPTPNPAAPASGELAKAKQELQRLQEALSAPPMEFQFVLDNRPKQAPGRVQQSRPAIVRQQTTEAFTEFQEVLTRVLG